MNKEIINIEFGRYIHKHRMGMGISLRKFAFKVGISATYISKMERGKFAPPSETKINMMAEVLELDKDELLTRAGRISKEVYHFMLTNPKKWLKACRQMRRKSYNKSL